MLAGKALGLTAAIVAILLPLLPIGAAAILLNGPEAGDAAADLLRLALLCAAALMGVTSGTIPPIYQALVPDRFGLASFGTVRGMIVPITAGTGAVAVRFIGEVFDRTGGYDIGFMVFVAADLLAAALIFATRYTRPLRTGSGVGEPVAS